MSQIGEGRTKREPKATCLIIIMIVFLLLYFARNFNLLFLVVVVFVFVFLSDSPQSIWQILLLLLLASADFGLSHWARLISLPEPRVATPVAVIVRNFVAALAALLQVSRRASRWRSLVVVAAGSWPSIKCPPTSGPQTTRNYKRQLSGANSAANACKCRNFHYM